MSPVATPPTWRDPGEMVAFIQLTGLLAGGAAFSACISLRCFVAILPSLYAHRFLHYTMEKPSSLHVSSLPASSGFPEIDVFGQDRDAPIDQLSRLGCFKGLIGVAVNIAFLMFDDGNFMYENITGVLLVLNLVLYGNVEDSTERGTAHCGLLVQVEPGRLHIIEQLTGSLMIGLVVNNG
ncbi:hypothetical protein BS17DRAFT_808623 [Gyrodon lividus]|nr:hypothetical protein BS17DRAFT_808623 [Gyrodon lividus]